MQDIQLLNTDVSRMYDRLRERPAGHNITFDKYIERKYIRRYERVESLRKAIKQGVMPIHDFYFRYLEKNNNEWILPLIGSKDDFGKTIHYHTMENSGYFKGLKEYFFDKIKIIKETNKEIILPSYCVGEMSLDGRNITNKHHAPEIRQALKLIDMESIALSKKEIKTDLIIGADILFYSGCFVTTACISSKGLPDNCAELTVLRGLRDDILSKSEEGKELIKEYYNIAPRIVKAVKESPNHTELLDNTYNEIRKIVTLTLDCHFAAATDKYRKEVMNLKNYCDLEKIAKFL